MAWVVLGSKKMGMINKNLRRWYLSYQSRKFWLTQIVVNHFFYIIINKVWGLFLMILNKKCFLSILDVIHFLMDFMKELVPTNKNSSTRSDFSGGPKICSCAKKEGCCKRVRCAPYWKFIRKIKIIASWEFFRNFH